MASQEPEPYYTRLQRELDELERTDPKVAAAAASYDAMVRQVVQGRVHKLPCTLDECEWHHPTDRS